MASILLVLPGLCLLFLMQNHVSGSRISKGPCPNLHPEYDDYDENFNVTLYKGTWYLQKMLTMFNQNQTYQSHWTPWALYYRLLPHVARCPKQVIGDVNNTTPLKVENSVRLHFIPFLSYQWSVQGFASLHPGENGALDVTLKVPIFGNVQNKLRILATDYDGWALAWTCNQYLGENYNIQSAFFLTRMPNETHDSIAETVLKTYNLPSDYFVKMKQTGCYWED